MAKTRTIDRKLYAETRYADGSFEMTSKRGRRSAGVSPYDDLDRHTLILTVGRDGGGREFRELYKLETPDALALARAWASVQPKG